MEGKEGEECGVEIEKLNETDDDELWMKGNTGKREKGEVGNIMTEKYHFLSLLSRNTSHIFFFYLRGGSQGQREK